MTTDAAPRTVTYVVVDRVARIELNRPEVSNAVDLQTAAALGRAVDAAAQDDSVRAVVVTGAGARFCAGGDVAAMMGSSDRGEFLEELARALDDSLQRLAALEKPVVAGVRGAVAGAGLAVMLSCDVVVAGAGTKFVTAYSGVGLTPDCGLSWLLPRAVGQQRALELLLVNRAITASVARDWGLVTEVVDDDAVTARAKELGRTLADGPAFALGQARRLVRASWESTRADIGALEARTIGRAAETEDAARLLEDFASSARARAGR
jgi:2-(1,2-epoxy-1,2-dihydrophenyl)acetyl-CoA isomerase